jgi:hypothetical protein
MENVNTISDVSMTTWLWLAGFMVIWMTMAFKRPVQMTIILVLSFFVTVVHPISDMVFYTIVYGLFSTTFGKMMIVAAGLGFILSYTDKK